MTSEKVFSQVFFPRMEKNLFEKWIFLLFETKIRKIKTRLTTMTIMMIIRRKTFFFSRYFDDDGDEMLRLEIGQTKSVERETKKKKSNNLYEKWLVIFLIERDVWPVRMIWWFWWKKCLFIKSWKQASKQHTRGYIMLVWLVFFNQI